MKYIEERYSKRRVDQRLERISVISFILGLVIVFIGMAITLFDPYYEIGMAVIILGFCIMVLGLLTLVLSSETLERRYKVLDPEDITIP